jgi:hypothetical protein
MFQAIKAGSGFAPTTEQDWAYADQILKKTGQWETVNRLGGFLDPHLTNGRLTFTSGNGAYWSDVSAAGTLYFTPYSGGNRIVLRDTSNTRWQEYTFSELSLSLSSTSNGSLYYVYVYDGGSGPIMYQDGTAPVAGTDGILTHPSNAALKAVGSWYCISGAGYDSSHYRCLFNQYNQVPRFYSLVTTGTYYGLGAGGWRVVNSDNNNCVVVNGGYNNVYTPIYVKYTGSLVALSSNQNGVVGLGLNTGSSPSGFWSGVGVGTIISQQTNVRGIAMGEVWFYTGGAVTVFALEASPSGGMYFENNGVGAGGTTLQLGMTGFIFS